MIYYKELKKELERSKYDKLTGDQQRDLIIKYRNGDQKAKELLMNSALRLIYKKAEYYSNGSELFDTDELFSEGYIYFQRKLDDFDLDHGSECKFVNYAIDHAVAYMIKYINKNKVMIHIPESSSDQIEMESIDMNMNVSNDTDTLHFKLKSNLPKTDYDTNKKDSLDRMTSLLTHFFTPIEADVLNALGSITEEYVYFDDLASKHKVTSQRLYQIKDKAIEKFKKKFGDTPQKVFSNLY